MTTENDLDLFDDISYAGGQEGFAFCQILNGKKDKEIGFFISRKNALQVDYPSIPFKDITKQDFLFTTAEGEEIEGFRILHPRLLVISQTNLFMENKLTKAISPFDLDTYNQDRDNYKTKRKYLIVFLDNNNELLHEIPLQYTASGASGASFSDNLGKFRNEYNKVFNKVRSAHGKKPMSFGPKFHSMTVFCPSFKAELKGQEKKSWVCSTTGYDAPTEETYRYLTVGFNPANKSIVEGLYEHYKSFADFPKGTVQPTTKPANSASYANDALLEEVDTEIPF